MNYILNETDMEINPLQFSGLSNQSKKILALGNAAGGKSRLCRALSKKLNIPMYSLDLILWKPGWILTPDEEYHQKQAELLQHDKWIIEGLAPLKHVEACFQEADTIIFVDLPLYMHYWWATKRQIKCIFTPSIDAPPGCPMLPVTFKMYRVMWQTHTQLRPKILSLLSKYETTKHVIYIKSAKQINLLLKNL